MEVAKQFKKGFYINNGKEYSQKLINVHAEHLPIKNIAINDIDIEEDFFWQIKSLSSFVYHMKRILTKDIDKMRLVLLNENKTIIDGNHRIAKAILEGKKMIKARIFNKFPHI